MTPKGGKSNIHDPANNTNSMPLSHVGLAYNIHPQVPAINSSVFSLSYEELQLDNPNSWDGHTNPISMFGQNTS